MKSHLRKTISISRIQHLLCTSANKSVASKIQLDIVVTLFTKAVNLLGAEFH